MGLASSSIKCQETLLPVTKLQRSQHGCNDNVSGNFLHGYWRCNGYWRTHRSFFEIVKSNPCLRARRMGKYSEKRSESRLSYGTPITIEESGVCFLYRARLANYSCRGLYFETDLFLHPGAKIYIGIQDSSHRLFPEDYGSFLVEIIWRKRLTEISSNFGYGAKMIFDKAEKKLQRNDHVELKELRKNPRKPFSKLTYFASGNKYYEGIIKNLGHGGAFIETNTTFSNGDELKLVVPGPNKYFQIRCKIIHFNQTGFGVKFKSVLKIEKLPGTKRYGSQLTM
jgi:hypothetical protein